VNLIALPHTNEFVKLVNIGEPVRVSLEFHEELVKADPSLRPIALVLRDADSQEEAAQKVGISRAAVQRSAALLRGDCHEIGMGEYKIQPVPNEDKDERERRITEIVTECRARGMSAEETRLVLNQAGALTKNGTPFSTRSVNRWAESRQIPFVSKSNDVKKVIIELRNQGLSFQKIAEKLNDLGLTNLKGNTWNRSSAESSYRVATGGSRKQG